MRSQKSGIGFAAEVVSKTEDNQKNTFFKDAEPQDLVRFGLIPEFVGRLPVHAILKELDEDSLIEILTKPQNALIKQYVKLFAIQGVTLEFNEDAIHAIAKKALQRKTGARGLRSILETVLLDIMFDLPGQNLVRKVLINADVVNNQSPPQLISA